MTREGNVEQGFISVDPASELYPSFSPYAYTLQNPLRYVDPTGMVVEDPPTEAGKHEGQTHYDPDTGATYEWDGKGTWHSDMGGENELSEVTINAEISENNNGKENPDYNDIGAYLGVTTTAINYNSLYNSTKIYRYGDAFNSARDLTIRNANRMSNIGKYSRLFGRIGGGATIGLDYMSYQEGEISGGEFVNNSAWTGIGMVGGSGGFAVSFLYYLMGDVLGGHERAKANFNYWQSLTPQQKRREIKKSLDNKHGRRRLRNPKF